MSSLSIPSSSTLPASELVPATHPAVLKSFLRLSRAALLGLVLDWLDERNQEHAAPYLLAEGEADEEQDFYPAAASLAELRDTYTHLQAAPSGTKRDLVARITECDWRRGISLYQLAMLDMQYLYDHQASQKWSALKLVHMSAENERGESVKAPPATAVPRFHPATFLRNLQREMLPDVKAYYNLDRHPKLPLIILRMFFVESPYNTSLAISQQGRLNMDSTKTFYVAFPDASPYVYVSIATASFPDVGGGGTARRDLRSLRLLALNAVPKAFSRPRERYMFETTDLVAKNLTALMDLRGGGRTNNAAGGWSIYAHEKSTVTPLNLQLPTPFLQETDVNTNEEEDEPDAPRSRSTLVTGLKRRRDASPTQAARRRQVAASRFGPSAQSTDGKGIEKFAVRLDDPFPDGDSNDTFIPDVRLTFNGTHVFAGIRQLVECGVIDGHAMPGWLTGEHGVSLGVVSGGRLGVNK